MKRTVTIFLLSFALLSYSSFARCANFGEELESSLMEEEVEVQLEFGKTRAPMDGLTLLMGVFSPLHDEIKDMYGSGFTLSGRYCLNMSGSTDVLASIGFMQNGGDPYYNVSTFSSSEPSTLSIIPLEVSVRRRIVLTRSPSGLVLRGLYAGVGINYIRATEEVPQILSASGGDFGMQIFAGPHVFFTDNIAFEGEVKLLMNEVDMKYEDNRYSLTLTGLVIRAALSWYY